MSSPWKINYSRYKRFFINSVSEYKKRRELKTYLEVFLSLLTIVIFAIFALRPTLITIAKLTKEIESKKETIAKMDEKIEDLKSARKLYDQESAKIQLLDMAIPKDPLPETLVRQIQGITNENMINVTAMSLGKVTLVNKTTKTTKSEKSDSFPENSAAISFGLNSIGDYSSFLKLLEGFEELRRPVKIDFVTLEANKTKEEKILVLRVNGRVPYFVPEP